MTTQFAKKMMSILSTPTVEATTLPNSESARRESSPKAASSPTAAASGGGILQKLRRWNITNNWEDCEPEDDATQAKKGQPKTPETTKVLIGALKENYMFSQLNNEDLDQMITAMARVQKQAGDIIIRQGHKGTEFFIMEKGQADVFVNEKKVSEYGPGGCFGDLALIYNAKRAATIVATTNCILWSLDLRTFRRMLATASSSQTMARIEFLRRVPILKNLTNEQISKLAGALTPQSFAYGGYIIKQGDSGETFYLIKEGVVKCTQTKMNREVELSKLHAGDYFGEMALLLDEQRHANVVALEPVEVLTLEKENFIKLLGPVRDVLNRQMRIRVLKSVPLLSRLSDLDLDHLGNAMRVQQFDANQYIVREGEPGTRFYIINEGVVKCCKRNEQGKDEEVLRLHDQEYFGERALLKEEPRAASVVAVTRTECLVLERSEFNALLGDLEQIMSQEVKRREEMVNKAAQPAVAPKPVLPKLHYKIDELEILRTLGCGTFGRVKLARHKVLSAVGALKCMQKSQVIAFHQERNIMNEKNILAECQHPFVLNLMGTLADHDQIYFMLELVQGGELWVYIYERFDLLPRSKCGGFRKQDAQFYAGCVVSAFEYIHGLGVAYRDLKPENLLMDGSGYLKIVDFGFAKRIPFEKNGAIQTKSFTLCGTPEYLSPELVLSRGHDKSVDYWAFGCLLYELLAGQTPFQDDNQAEIFKKIINSLKALSFPRGMDSEAQDLIKKLLSPNPAFRLGNLLGGVREIMDHRFFDGMDWNRLVAKEVQAPYVPIVRDPMDVSNFDPYPDDEVVAIYNGPQHYFEQF